MAKLSNFAPCTGRNATGYANSEVAGRFRLMAWCELPIDKSHNPDLSPRLRSVAACERLLPRGTVASCPHQQKWSDIRISQSPIEALELVQEFELGYRETLEFRAVILCPRDLLLGLLYDAVKHWHDIERSRAQLLWHRKTGDVTCRGHAYADGIGFTTTAHLPCVTILGRTAGMCDQEIGLTSRNWEEGQGSRVQVINSGGEDFQYCMSEPKTIWHEDSPMDAENAARFLKNFQFGALQ
ncbi:hypothetical protein PWT90_10060 [Aphanocladium album]|nr:hypothetical protein PWT90_10060 [Aphanocladium album]